MKKRFLTVLACVLCLSLCGCPAVTPEDTHNPSGDSIPISIPTTAPKLSSEPTQQSEPAPSESAHSHVWLSASCTDPEVCADCGKTQGEALGHNWQAGSCTQASICSTCGISDGEAPGHSWTDATCTVPKTCENCGQTEGKAAGHDYEDGACSRCGAWDPNTETLVWIPTNGGTKYHTHAGCSNMKNPEQVPLSEAEDLGFTPCKRCH